MKWNEWATKRDILINKYICTSKRVCWSLPRSLAGSSSSWLAGWSVEWVDGEIPLSGAVKVHQSANRSLKMKWTTTICIDRIQQAHLVISQLSSAREFVFISSLFLSSRTTNHPTRCSEEMRWRKGRKVDACLPAFLLTHSLTWELAPSKSLI